MTRVAVVGASGCVGREMLSLLEQRPLSAEAPTLFGSDASRGKSLPYRGEPVPIRCLEDDPGEFDVVLFAAGSDVARSWAPRFVERGAVVVDNSSAFRLDPEVPLVVPELNGDLVITGPGIVANPNCSTIILVMAVGPLLDLGRFRGVVATYQAVSGAGRLGLEALERERAGGAFEPDRPFPFPIEGNLFPLIGPIDSPSGETGEELKMTLESRKILGRPDLELYTTCVRVPVERCHSEAVTLLFDAPIDLPAVRDRLANAPGVRLLDEPVRPPTPVDCTRDHRVSVGRVRAPSPTVIQMWLVGDQLLKGAALNAVQIAECAIERSSAGPASRD